MIQVESISKSFGQEKVLKEISFSLEAHQTLSILGKSGCGKTTLLKVLAGLEDANSGKFLVEGIDKLQQTPQKRKVVYISQEPLLFPHMSVVDNIAYGLHVRKIKKEIIHEQVDVMLEQLGLREHSNKFPHQLSGGQKQRVAFGRALIVNPTILLLDEPFSSLDTQTREEMQIFFLAIREKYAITAIFVTHDVKEALLMANKNAVRYHIPVAGHCPYEQFYWPASGIW